MVIKSLKLTALIFGIFLFVGTILPQTVFAQNYENSPFGFHYASQLEDYTTDLGIKWVRVNAVWGMIQTEEDIITGNFNWNAFESDSKINAYPDNTYFLITLSVLGTPLSGTGTYVPHTGVYADTSWISFTKAVVTRYQDRVKYFQVENEPKPYKTDFAELQEITYNAIKEECLECQVLMGGVFWAKGSLSEWDILNQQILIDLNGNYVDIFDQHYYGNSDEYNPHILLEHARQRLTEANFIETPIWITEMGDYSGDPLEKGGLNPPYQSEQVQAQSLFKRYVSSLVLGIDKIFWAFGLYEGFHHDTTYFDFTGLIYDGEYDHDLGYGVKKLAYYTYKKMTEMLEGSNWDSITTIIDSVDNNYAYKFINDSTGEPTYIAWWDYFDDISYPEADSSLLTLSEISSNQVIVTNAVPNDIAGIYITDFNTAFVTDTLNVTNGSVSFYLKESPVFIEAYNSTSVNDNVFDNNIDIFPNPTNGIFTVEGTNIQLVEIINIKGQTIKQLSIDNEHLLINLSDRSKGIYFVKIVNDRGIIRKKIVLIE